MVVVHPAFAESLGEALSLAYMTNPTLRAERAASDHEEADGGEGHGDYSALIADLDRLRENGGAAAPSPSNPAAAAK